VSARLRRLAGLAFVLASAGPVADAAPRVVVMPEPPGSAGVDPVSGLVRRMDSHLQRFEVDGVTMDWRYEVSPSEEIRQTVVCQVLAYAELDRLRPTPRLREDLVEHADFLLGRLEEIRSHTPFDGMLAYALLAAGERTGEARFTDVGRAMSDELFQIPTWQCRLNGGLMVAMALAHDAAHGGGTAKADKARAILAQLPAEQNEDGSFPHWCTASRDIHYTGWMAMELVHIARWLDDPLIEPMLARMTAYLAGRIGPEGRSIYSEPCPGGPVGCTIDHYSRATGCDFDYDTRGWTVEPVYQLLTFDRAGDPAFTPVLAFVHELEDVGTFSDLYGYPVPPEDPEYPWTIADTSIVNMSVIFWVLATVLSEREARGIAVDARLDDPPIAIGVPPQAARSSIALAASPNPARRSTRIACTLPEAGPATLDLLDVAGRRVWRRSVVGKGDSTARFDGNDDAGRRLPPGVYALRLSQGGHAATARLVLLR